MARRRVNVRFIVMSASGLAVAAAGVVVAYKFHRPINPAPYVAAGDQAMKQSDFVTAIRNYSVAEEVLPMDTSLHLKLGRCYFETRQISEDNFSSAVVEFTKAEQLNPNSKDAWTGLLESNLVRLETYESRPIPLRERQQLPASINMVREAAEHLVKLDPTNVQARATEPILIIRVWLMNLAMPMSPAEQSLPLDKRPTADQKGEQAINDLTVLMRDHPENEKYPYWIARAKILQAKQLLRSDTPANAAPLFAEAAKQFDASISARPELVPLYLNKATILTMLKDVDPAAAAGVDYRKKIHEALDAAQSLADPKDPAQYQLAKQQWARNLAINDPARAEAVYRDLITRFPNELGSRIELARMLKHDASRRNDALALLDAIPTIPGDLVVGTQPRNNWDIMVAYSKLVRADIETDQLAAIPPGKAHDALAADIKASLDASGKRFADTTDLLRVKGQFQLTNGQTRDAILTLTAAADKMTTESGLIDYELLRLEATAYRKGQQIGKAIELLEKAMSDPMIANNAEIHLTLAQLHLQNQDFARAKPYVDWLAVRYPEDPQILALQITDLGPGADPAAIMPLYNKLPEKNPGDVASKYGVATQIHNRDEMIRLLKIINANNPGDISTVSDLAQQLKRANRQPEANDIIAAAEKIHPGDKTLAIVRQVMADAPRAEIDDQAIEAINAIPDPFIRAMKLSQMYQIRQQPEDEMIQLQKAREIQPDNKQVLQTIFIRYMDSRQFPKAEAMLPHLSELDADDAHGVMLRCKLALAKQDVQNSLQYGRQLTHDYPSFSDSWELYGEALHLSGQFDLASQQFVAALALQATNVPASKNLIQCSVQLGKFDDAKAYIKDACQRFPNDPTYQDMWVQFQILYGNPESVLPELLAVIKQHPEAYRYYGITGDALQASMRAKAAQGDSEAARNYFTQTKDLFQSAVTRWPDDLKVSSDLAQLLLQSNDVAGAETVIKTISDRPHWKGQPAPLLQLAQVYMIAGKLDLAETALHQAHQAAPQSAQVLLVLSDCLIREHKYDEALAVLQPAVSNFSVRVKYTDLLLGLNRGPQAEYEVSEAIKAEPQNVAATNLMLHVYDAEGKQEQGIKAATDAVIANRDNVTAYFWRAKLASGGRVPDLESAIKDLGYFLDAAPTDVDAHVLLAQDLDIKRDRDGAIRELESALKFAPQDRRVRLGLIRDYFTSVPPRSIDGERLLKQTLALPGFAHDPEFETQAALVLASKDSKESQDRAVAIIQDAMKNSQDQQAMLKDYFNVLLETKNYDLLLTESDKYTSDPKASWLIYCDRGLAKNMLHDTAGANAEFEIALNRAGTEPSRDAAESVASAISRQTGVDKALEKILPRAQNSTLWKLIAIDLYIAKGDATNGLKMIDSAMGSIDTLTPGDQYQLLRQASGLYISANPPMADKAMETYKKQLAMNPNDISAMNDIACVLADMIVPSKPQEALVWSQRAFDLVQQNGRMDTRIFDTQGWVLILNGRIDDGIEVLHQAIDQAQFPEAHYHLAEGYLRKQLPEDAQRELDNAKSLIQQNIANHVPFDASLKNKITAASKEADEIIKVKMSGKAAASIP